MGSGGDGDDYTSVTVGGDSADWGDDLSVGSISSVMAGSVPSAASPDYVGQGYTASDFGQMLSTWYGPAAPSDQAEYDQASIEASYFDIDDKGNPVSGSFYNEALDDYTGSSLGMTSEQLDLYTTSRSQTAAGRFGSMLSTMTGLGDSTSGLASLIQGFVPSVGAGLVQVVMGAYDLGSDVSDLTSAYESLGVSTGEETYTVDYGGGFSPGSKAASALLSGKLSAPKLTSDMSTESQITAMNDYFSRANLQDYIQAISRNTASKGSALGYAGKNKEGDWVALQHPDRSSGLGGAFRGSADTVQSAIALGQAANLTAANSEAGKILADRTTGIAQGKTDLESYISSYSEFHENPDVMESMKTRGTWTETVSENVLGPMGEAETRMNASRAALDANKYVTFGDLKALGKTSREASKKAPGRARRGQRLGEVQTPSRPDSLGRTGSRKTLLSGVA